MPETANPNPNDDNRQNHQSLLPKSERVQEVLELMGIDFDALAGLPDRLSKGSMAKISVDPLDLNKGYLEFIAAQINKIDEFTRNDSLDLDSSAFLNLGFGYGRALVCLQTCHEIISSTVLSDECTPLLLDNVSCVAGRGDKDETIGHELPTLPTLNSQLAWLGCDAVYLNNLDQSSQLDERDKNLLSEMFIASIHHLHVFCDFSCQHEDNNTDLHEIVEAAIMQMAIKYPEIGGKALSAWNEPIHPAIFINDAIDRYKGEDPYQLTSGEDIALLATNLRESFQLLHSLSKTFAPIAKQSVWHNPFGELQDALSEGSKIQLKLRRSSFPFDDMPSKVRHSLSDLCSKLDRKPLILFDQECLHRLVKGGTESFFADITEVLQEVLLENQTNKDFSPESISRFISTVDDNPESLLMARKLIGNLRFFRDVVPPSQVQVLPEAQIEKILADNPEVPIILFKTDLTSNIDLDVRIKTDLPDDDLKDISSDWSKCNNSTSLVKLFSTYLLENIAKKHGTDSNGFVGYYNNQGLADIAAAAGHTKQVRMLFPEQFQIQLVGPDDNDEATIQFDDSFVDNNIGDLVNS